MITSDELELLINQTYKVEREFSELKHSYARLQETIKELVEFLPNALWILSEDGSIFLQNSQAKKLGGLIERLYYAKEDYEVAYDGRFYLIKSSRYQDKMMISATDITEQKRKENLATMGQMAAHLSHEIRNPIGSISLLTSTLKSRVKQENLPIVEEIQKSVYRIDRIIKATLMFSKGIKAHKAPFRWDELKAELMEAIAYYGYTKEIAFELPKERFVLNADRDLLEMMFVNFLTNAIDAIELSEDPSGWVRITYSNKEGYHVFHIYDSGVAIEDSGALFEAFRSTKVKGNGLGLILARQIARAHGGDVEYLPQEEQKCFRVTLEV